MERIVIDFALVIVAIGLGYLMGFRACFDYLDEEIQKYKEEDNAKRNGV